MCMLFGAISKACKKNYVLFHDVRMIYFGSIRYLRRFGTASGFGFNVEI
jgi:hypothetical protein